ncbi:hypothetical protein AQF98_09055 [Pedobacter sp. Hv1]|nr:hypothetical protein AQF98_09055 [Pedobacter sp. Hv1]
MSAVKAQVPHISIKVETNTNRSIDYIATKTDPGTFLVVLNFTNLTNSLSKEREIATITGYAGNVYTMRPENKNQDIRYSNFTFSYIRGKLNPKYDPEFVYLLPYQNGTKVKALELTDGKAKYLGSTTPNSWKIYRFSTDAADTVTAVRKGIVVELKDIYDTDSREGVAFTSNQNFIMIEHADGTLAEYNGFKKGSTTVKVGDVVFPGASLGMSSKASENAEPSITLVLSYLKSADFESAKDKTKQRDKSLYGYITGKFLTGENSSMVLESNQVYTSVIAPAIVQKELTKKELKALVKK